MKERNGKRLLITGCAFVTLFVVWTLMLQKIDVRPVGVNGTSIGFAALNGWFHALTGVYMEIRNPNFKDAKERFIDI